MKLRTGASERVRPRGQILVMVTIAIPVLILFAGLAIDFGIAYTDEMALSRAVDAAALEGMRNLSQGTSVARQLATDTFNVNVQALGNYTTPPTFSFTQATDGNGNQTVTITGTVYWQPILLSLLLSSPVPISQSATASRAPLYMSLVLDQSYSMTGNGGGAALPTAVTNFVNQFDDTQDHVAVVSFGTYATTGVKMSSSPPFKSAVSTYVNKMGFALTDGYTFAQTGLDNGLAQINSVSLPSNAQKVMVFFTDGWPNMVQDNLNCSSKSGTRTLLNFTMCDPGDVSLGLCSNNFPLAVFTTSGGNTTCGTCTSYPGYSSSDPCDPAPSGMTFNSQQYSKYETPTMTNISNEAFYRAEASALTAQNQNVTVYSIGLGNAITKQTQAQNFLYQVANDPAGPAYNSSMPQGQAVFAPTSAQLNAVFQQIASKILLRITQ
ncbi:MAG TPA: TadE/TadG family type IV pilus assembly protein [Candidatus Binataceae bacterium]|nr:TadE/TadG family type IV pilus assembly protein [Candidatus Binataceae bacterium]